MFQNLEKKFFFNFSILFSLDQHGTSLSNCDSSSESSSLTSNNYANIDTNQQNFNEYTLAYNNVAAVYSQLDSHYYPTVNNNHHHHQAKSNSSQRHNPYSRNSNLNTNTSSISSNISSNSNENSNVAAAILSSLGNYSVASNPTNSYSAALYYHPYYYNLHHPSN